MTYVYRQIDTQKSSAHFGPCEICGNHVNTVFHQIEGRIYQDPDTHQDAVTHHECHSLFGHKECLIGKQKAIGPLTIEILAKLASP